MKPKDKWLKNYPMTGYKKADCKKIRNSVGEKLSEQKGEVIYMKKRSFKPIAVTGAVLAVSAMSVFTVNAATDGAVVDKIKEWTANVTVYINGKEVEMPAKVKEIDESCIEFEFEITDDADGENRVEYFEFHEDDIVSETE